MDARASVPKYRPSVAAILQDVAGRILIGERRDTSGAWQFPQGGVEPGEPLVTALQREVEEELGLAAGLYTVGISMGPYRYLFPPGRTKNGFEGQEQQYFLLSLCDPSAVLNIATAAPEFRAVRWIEPADFRLEWLPKMKREVYAQVFRDFFRLELH